MITFSDLQWLCEKMDQSLSGLGTCFPSREERLAEEERRAWDVYFAQMNRCMSRDMALAEVNRMLEARRKRFGSGKETDGERRVSVTVEVLMRVIETLGEVDTIRSEALRATLRALVSE